MYVQLVMCDVKYKFSCIMIKNSCYGQVVMCYVKYKYAKYHGMNISHDNDKNAHVCGSLESYGA